MSISSFWLGIIQLTFCFLRNLPERLSYHLNVPGEALLWSSFQRRPAPFEREFIPRFAAILSTLGRAKISLILDVSSSLSDFLAARLLTSCAKRFPCITRITIRLPLNDIMDSEESEGHENDYVTELPMLEELSLQVAVVNFHSIRRHRRWLFKTENAQQIRSLELDSVTAPFLQHLISHLPNLLNLTVRRILLHDDGRTMSFDDGEPCYYVAHPTLQRMAVPPEIWTLHTSRFLLDCPSLCALDVGNINPSLFTIRHPAKITTLNVCAVDMVPVIPFLAGFANVGLLQLSGIFHGDLLSFAAHFKQQRDPILPSLRCLILTYRGSMGNNAGGILDAKEELSEVLQQLIEPRASGCRIEMLQLQLPKRCETNELVELVGMLEGLPEGSTGRIGEFNDDLDNIQSLLDIKDIVRHPLNPRRLSWSSSIQLFQAPAILHEKWEHFTDLYQDIGGVFLMATASARKEGAIWDGEYLHNQIWPTISRVQAVLSGTEYANGHWRAIVRNWENAFWKDGKAKGWMMRQGTSGGAVLSRRDNWLLYGQRMGSIVDPQFRKATWPFRYGTA